MFGDNRATPRPKRPRSINASFPSPQRDSQNNSLRVFWRVLHPRGICVGNWRRVRRAFTPLWRAPHAGFHVETPSRSCSGFAPALVRSHAAAEPLQWCCGRYCVRDWTARPGCAGNPDPGSPRHSNHQRLDLAGDGRPPWSPRRGRIFLAISFRCQANSLSGETMVATSARSFRPNPLDLAANRRTWSSFNRSRRH